MRVSISSTVSNVDPNTNFSLVNVITVAFYCCRSVVVLAGAPHPPNDINRHRTTALGAIKGDKPSLATSVAVKKKVALINNMESGIIFPLVENTILQNSKARSLCNNLIPPKLGANVVRKMFSPNAAVLLS